MIPIDLARRLRDSGLRWRPAPGDAFSIDRPDFEAEIFTVSDMTIEAHEFDTGTVLGFNGTTEWALDSVALENALWLPREEQLRELLAGTFRSLTVTDAGFRVDVVLAGNPAHFDALDDASQAYGIALLALIELAVDTERTP